MIAFIHTPFGSLSTFTVAIAAGLLCFFGVLHFELKKGSGSIFEEGFIFPKALTSFIFAYLFSAVVDSVFKIPDNGGFVFSGITFYGGLIGGVICMFVLLTISKSKTQYTLTEWFDFLTPPLISFHICGRLGCFFAGCCYGKETAGPLGIAFPDNPVEGIFHNGQKCYPTQLFEVFALTLILIAVSRTSKKFELYMSMYAAARFIIEFFRGDNRGSLFAPLSPAQVISIVIIAVEILFLVLRKRRIIKLQKRC